MAMAEDSSNESRGSGMARKDEFTTIQKATGCWVKIKVLVTQWGHYAR